MFSPRSSPRSNSARSATQKVPYSPRRPSAGTGRARVPCCSQAKMTYITSATGAAGRPPCGGWTGIVEVSHAIMVCKGSGDVPDQVDVEHLDANVIPCSPSGTSQSRKPCSTARASASRRGAKSFTSARPGSGRSALRSASSRSTARTLSTSSLGTRPTSRRRPAGKPGRGEHTPVALAAVSSQLDVGFACVSEPCELEWTSFRSSPPSRATYVRRATRPCSRNGLVR